MIEAAEYATPYQRRLYERYQEIHRKFFPRPPVFPEAQPEAQPEQPPEPIPAIPVKPIDITQTKLRMRIIRRVVCASFSITQEFLISEQRTAKVVVPRHLCAYLISRFTTASLPTIGKSLGDRDHTTIIHAIRRTGVRIAADRKFAERVHMIEQEIRNELGETSRPRHCIARYVEHHRVADYLLIGWMWAANLNEYAALLIWPCGCQYVEPK
jgi:hypothetical protein